MNMDFANEPLRPGEAQNVWEARRAREPGADEPGWYTADEIGAMMERHAGGARKALVTLLELIRLSRPYRMYEGEDAAPHTGAMKRLNEHRSRWTSAISELEMVLAEIAVDD